MPGLHSWSFSSSPPSLCFSSVTRHKFRTMASEQVFEGVVPTRDVVHSFMETLVDPRLPYSVSESGPPSADAQNSVAKQMRAVVLLYNYYYRKQKPELEFLDVVSFCKLAVSLRVTMTLFMRATRGSESNFDKDRLSVTEEAVKDACDIAATLDASRDFPNLEGCPVSKVAILVTDSEKENCLLRFGPSTEGVWSLIEKDLDSSLDLLVSGDNKVGMKRKSAVQKAIDDHKLVQIAYDAVKGIAGIDRDDLVVLESHYTYSLSKEKSAVKFYLMKYCKTIDIKQRTPLEFLVESLRGPLVKKSYDDWMSTDFVVYHEMLPYVRFISSWLSSFWKDLCLPSLNAPSIANSSSIELSRSRVAPAAAASPSSADLKSSPPRWLYQKLATKNNTPSAFTKRSEVADSVKEKIVINSNFFDSDDYEYLKGSSPGASRELQSISGFNKTSSDSKYTRKKLNSRQEVYNQKSAAQHGANLQSDTPDQKKPTKATLEIVQFEAPSDMIMANKQNSEDLDSALALSALTLLNGKRQELCSKICTLEDALVIHEDCMERIRVGGDIDLARRCFNSIMSGNKDLLSKTEVQNQTGFSNIFLPGRSSFQDLEYTCIKNNWRLPRYIVEPTDGKFFSMVVVRSNDFELSLKGDWENSPGEARESAAAQMIVKLRERFSGY